MSGQGNLRKSDFLYDHKIFFVLNLLFFIVRM